MPRLFRRSHRYNVAKNSFLARIILLDSTSIEFNLLAEVTGADCLEKVAQVLDIQEIAFFGLLYQNKSEAMRWVDKDKPLRKQLEKHSIDGARNAELRFGVQYYVTNVTKLHYEITRYLYYLQLKHLIMNGDLQCSHELAVKLASYAMQAEFGDFDEQKHTKDFLSDYIFLPPSLGPPPVIQQLTERASMLHQRYRAMSPASAELMYIKLAQQLPEYGHEAYQTLDIHGSTIWIGACFIGVFVKHSNGQPTIYFKWPDIYRMKVRDKNFGIETPGETIYFKMPDNHTAQYVLRMMILQHKFYRSELETTPGLSWLPGVEGKQRSRSLHDLRTKTTTLDYSHSLAVGGEKGKVSKDLQRPLHKNVYTQSGLEPMQLSNSGRDRGVGEVQLLSVSGDHANSRSNVPVDVTSQQNGPSAAQSHSPPNMQPADDSTDLGPPMVTVQEQQTTTVDSSPSPPASKYSPSPTHQPNLAVASGVHEKLPSGDYTGDTSSQETFDLGGSTKQKYKLTGSLEQLDVRTPPRSLKVRTYSVEEQEEQEAASGTYDRRGAHLEKKLKTGKFYSEYELLPVKKLGADTNAGQKPENVPKNRYRDILPYEDTRVKLNPKNNTAGNDYINASYVNFTVAGRTSRYVVAQGPLEHTCTDFWQMVWEQNITILLMLTNEMEDGRRKCFRYFPADDDEEGKPDNMHFDQYRISRLFVDKTVTVISRGFLLKHIPSGQERELMHLQYTDWPDHGIPEDPQPFIDFLADVRSLRQRYNSSIPILVHCSAGVGRSGVVVLVDMLIAMVDCGDPLDIPRCLKDLRQQRMHLVQMVGQYKFVYSAIIQYIKRARLI